MHKFSGSVTRKKAVKKNKSFSVRTLVIVQSCFTTDRITYQQLNLGHVFWTTKVCWFLGRRPCDGNLASPSSNVNFSGPNTHFLACMRCTHAGMQSHAAAAAACCYCSVLRWLVRLMRDRCVHEPARDQAQI